MAGIIGQLTANARKRKDAKVIESDKCVYWLPEFEQFGFNPVLHNNYVRNKTIQETQLDVDEDDSAKERKSVRQIIISKGSHHYKN